MSAQILSLTEGRQAKAEKVWDSVRHQFSTHHLHTLSVPDYVAEAWNLVVMIAEPRIEANKLPPITYEELTMCYRDAKRFRHFEY
jgi:hypothetical protein